MTQAKNRATPMDRDMTDKVRGGHDIVRENTVHEEQEFVYKPRALLDVDRDVQDHFTSHGYALRWIRWQSDGNIDSNRLEEVEYQGWTPVQSDEMPKNKAARMKVQSIPGFGDVFVKGDLALYKIDKRQQKAIVDYHNRVAEGQVINVNDRLKAAGAEVVLNESRTRVAKGQRATQFDD